MQYLLMFTCLYRICVNYGCMDVNEGYQGDGIFWRIMVLSEINEIHHGEKWDEVK